MLITGMSGLIGGLLRRHLENLGGYELRALNRRPVDGVECYRAEIRPSIVTPIISAARTWWNEAGAILSAWGVITR